MATPIKIIPTLHGETARRFIERAEEKEREYEKRNLKGPARLYNESEWQAYRELLKEAGLLND